MPIDELSRRTFLLAGGAVVTGAMVGCGGGAGVLPLDLDGETEVDPFVDAGSPEARAAAREADPIVASLTRHDFDRWRGELFDFTDEEGGNTTVELVEVTDYSSLVNAETRARGMREPFSVRFHGPLDSEFGEGRYDVSHPDMGDVTLFVSYGGTTEEANEQPLEGHSRIYFASFN